MESKAFPLVGWSLVIIGILRNLSGFFASWQVLLDMVGVGPIGVWDTPPIRGRIFRFLVTGFTLTVVDLLTARLERSGVATPWSFIMLFSLLTLAGVVPTLISGFWLLLSPVTVCLMHRLCH